MKRFMKRSVPNDKAAGWIANGILKVQRKFADALGKVSATWKAKQQLIFLYLITLVLGGLSVIAIVKPFDKKAPNTIPKPAAISIPRAIPDENKNSVRITDHEISRVHQFKQMLDSLSKTSEGKLKVKS